jgi:hypothetical protein
MVEVNRTTIMVTVLLMVITLVLLYGDQVLAASHVQAAHASILFR